MFWLFFDVPLARRIMAQAAAAAALAGAARRPFENCPPNLWTTLWKTRVDLPQTRANAFIGFDCFIFQHEIFIENQGLARF